MNRPSLAAGLRTSQWLFENLTTVVVNFRKLIVSFKGKIIITNYELKLIRNVNIQPY